VLFDRNEDVTPQILSGLGSALFLRTTLPTLFVQLCHQIGLSRMGEEVAAWSVSALGAAMERSRLSADGLKAFGANSVSTAESGGLSVGR
jgi:hypothetical protein